jgi:hypothetical protein
LYTLFVLLRIYIILKIISLKLGADPKCHGMQY